MIWKGQNDRRTTSATHILYSKFYRQHYTFPDEGKIYEKEYLFNL